jgi:hypothetical protein
LRQKVVKISESLIHEGVQIPIGSVRVGCQLGLSRTFLGKPGAPSIGKPDLHRAQTLRPQTFPSLPNAMSHRVRHAISPFA